MTEHPLATSFLSYICTMTTVYDHDNVVPDKDSALSKKEQVAGMFDHIAHRYDFLNRFLSAGIDVRWRKKAIKQLKSLQPHDMLDVATGTADMAILSYKILSPNKITGIDISDGMLEFGRKKIQQKNLQSHIELINGDSEAIPFADNSFDAVMVAFGVRNFQNLEKGMQEIRRVLRPGGRLVVLEFSKPSNRLVKFFYNIYMKRITPMMGRLFSKNKQAYQYLDESIRKFPEGKQFLQVLERSDYADAYHKPMTFGICSIYCATK
jgi:demethylmenaquinone methyltransferase/2-methoxy-6-polyprenyl-1,4-benzoquinol methylase